VCKARKILQSIDPFPLYFQLQIEASKETRHAEPTNKSVQARTGRKFLVALLNINRNNNFNKNVFGKTSSWGALLNESARKVTPCCSLGMLDLPRLAWSAMSVLNPLDRPKGIFKGQKEFRCPQRLRGVSE
jgi:hypothetical protein